MIDAHLHFWDPDLLSYPWLKDVPQINNRRTPEIFLAAISAATPSVDGAIFVQADCDPVQAMNEVDWVNTLSFPILGIVGYAPLELGATQSIEVLKSKPNVVGVRRNIQNESSGFMASTHYLQGMIAAARAGLTIDMCLKVHQMRETLLIVEQLIKVVPDAHIIVDHLCKPDIAGKGANINANEWATLIDAMASIPNMFCKLSGLATEANWQSWQSTDVTPFLEFAIEKFGASRCLFGGDWPVVELAGGWNKWHDAVNAAVSTMNTDDRKQIFHTTATQAYRLDARSIS